jgi:hypothetical protein
MLDSSAEQRLCKKCCVIDAQAPAPRPDPFFTPAVCQLPGCGSPSSVVWLGDLRRESEGWNGWPQVRQQRKTASQQAGQALHALQDYLLAHGSIQAAAHGVFARQRWDLMAGGSTKLSVYEHVVGLARSVRVSLPAHERERLAGARTYPAAPHLWH